LISKIRIENIIYSTDRGICGQNKTVSTTVM
jgi:hypothetical protein